MSEIDGHVSRNLAPENSVEAKFPEGLRVLAVDDNVVCLKLLAALLKKCRYKVTMTIKATEALEMLRKNKDSYDIVITDVKMLDMDGFELLEIIGLEMDIPVIMMSANDDTESVIKGVMHGARDYLLKPVRLEELKNIWQHVVRKNLFDPIKPSTAKVGTEQNQIPLKRQRNTSKEKEDETNTQSDDGESSAQKKHRVAWNQELHKKFLDAVQLLGVDKAVPKKILEIMNEPELSREHVASHLQKYRNLLKKEKKKANMSQESESNVNSNQANRHLPNTTIVTSDDQGLNTINFQNRSAEPGVSNVGITSMGNRFQTYGASPSSTRSLFYTMNRQDMLLQRDLLPPQMADQTRPNMPIPVLGSVPPTQILVPNPCPQPELNGTKFHSIHSRNKMVDDYVEMYSQVPSFGAGQPGPMPVSFVPYPCSPGAFNLGVPFQMLGDASTQLAPISQSDSLAMLSPSSFHGQHEGRNLVNLNGRGVTNSFPFDKRGQSIDLSTRNGWFVQTTSENLERESNGHYNSCSSPDDDLSVMVKQFSNNSAPRL